MNVGVLGTGCYLPPIVRKNDWWPSDVVASWRSVKPAQVAASADVGAAATRGQRAVLEAMDHVRGDPFQGALERRVMPDEMSAVDMEVRAAEEALERAQVERGEIDLVLVHTTVPDYLLSNNASLLHHRLGLPSRCIASGLEASANSFLLQLGFASAMIQSGQAKKALLVQSCSVSRLVRQEDPISPLFGDGATAVVVGGVSPGKGVLAMSHRTDGSHNRTLIASVRGKRWYEDGPVTLDPADADGGRRLFLNTIDCATEVVGDVLKTSGFSASSIDYFGVHQGTPWLRRVAQRELGLENARAVDTFQATGYLFAASIPLGFCVAEREGLLKAGARAVVFSGGTGVTYGAVAMLWGR